MRVLFVGGSFKSGSENSVNSNVGSDYELFTKLGVIIVKIDAYIRAANSRQHLACVSDRRLT